MISALCITILFCYFVLSGTFPATFVRLIQSFAGDALRRMVKSNKKRLVRKIFATSRAKVWTVGYQLNKETRNTVPNPQIGAQKHKRKIPNTINKNNQKGNVGETAIEKAEESTKQKDS